jgi:hypothetical protein
MRIIGNAGKAREVQAVASGVLSTGDTVIVNSDGTVSAVAGVSGGLGSEAVFENSNTPFLSSTFDSVANKIIVTYRDSSNSDYPTAVVGTVNGTSISFGTPVAVDTSAPYSTSRPITVTYDANSEKVVVFYSRDASSGRPYAAVGTVSGTSISFGTPVKIIDNFDTIWYAAAYDVTNQKVVVAYRDGSTAHGKAVVGTVSGTSISFGSVVTFESAATSIISMAYDENAGKIVIAYNDDGNSNYGTSIVGTVSGTSISFGSPVVFNSNYSGEIGATYEPVSQNIVIAYIVGGTTYGNAIVGTVSGTSISFGTSVVFENSATGSVSIAASNSGGTVLISYRDSVNSNYGTAILGTVSGTSVSFDPAFVFNAGASYYTATSFDSSEGAFAISCKDDGNSSYGTSIVYKVSSTNLTSENYIGTAASGAPSGQGAKINIKGAVDENQSGLTAGQSYYVQTDGTLGTTPADPSVFAGTAVAATKLIVKG